MLDLTGVPEIDNSQTPLALAITRMNENAPQAEMFREVAASIPQSVPDVLEVKGWYYGSCRVIGRIGGFDHWSIENGMTSSDIDLSKIDYIAFYRQAVKNKHTGKLGFFVVTIPLSFNGEVQPGASVAAPSEGIQIGWKREDVEAMARESLLKLQELVAEFYNREVA
jgi:hypothetical protein